uniref:Uncharacterized LOC100177693 n=1 Tax=Ciona intestinalis TaxID=7719 RepID=H2XSD0_CIOIN
MDRKIVFALLLLMSVQVSMAFHWNERKGAEPQFPPEMGDEIAADAERLMRKAAKDHWSNKMAKDVIWWEQ